MPASTDKSLELLLRFLGAGLLLLATYLAVAHTLPVQTDFFRSYAVHAIVASAAFGIVATVYWARIQHHLESDALHYVLQTVVRYFLAYIFVTYGFAKFFRTQLYEPFLIWQDTPVGQLSGFELTWTFFGSSYAYAAFIGVSQVLCAVLLLFRKTQLLGAILLLPVIGNIVVVNFAYDIPVKLNSCVFLVMTGYLLLSDYPRLKAFFWDNRPVRTRRDPKLPSKARKMAPAVKWSCIVLIFGWSFWRFQEMTSSKAYANHPVVGIWDVATFAVNGETEYVRTDPSESRTWDKMIFEAQFGGTQAYLKRGEAVDHATYTIDPEEQTLELSGPGGLFTGTYEMVDDSYMIVTGVQDGDSLRIELLRASRLGFDDL